VIEEAEEDLHLQDGTYSVVQLSLGNFSRGDQFGYIFDKSPAGHVHIEPGGQSLIGGILSILGKAVSDEAIDGEGVRDHKAREVPLFA